MGVWAHETCYDKLQKFVVVAMSKIVEKVWYQSLLLQTHLLCTPHTHARQNALFSSDMHGRNEKKENAKNQHRQRSVLVSRVFCTGFSRFLCWFFAFSLAVGLWGFVWQVHFPTCHTTCGVV